MKRQHPDNPDLFWCSKCGQYKESCEFNRRNGYQHHLLHSYCRSCENIIRNPIIKKYCIICKNELPIDSRQKYSNLKYCFKCKPLIININKIKNRLNDRKSKSITEKRYIDQLSDPYIKKCLKKNGYMVNEVTIDLKRQFIAEKRLLKQYKEMENQV